MTPFRLARIVKGPQRAALTSIASLVPGGCRVEDERGATLVGADSALDPGAMEHPIIVAGERVGVVRGAPAAGSVAALMSQLGEQELDRRALAAETLGRYKELSLIYDISDALSRVLEVEDVVELVANEAHRFLSADQVTLFLLDAHTRRLRPAAARGALGGRATLEAATRVRARVVESGQAEFVALSGHEGDIPPVAHAGLGAIMCAPLRTGEHVVGVLELVNERSDQWTAGDLKLATALAANASSAVSRATLHRDRLHQQSLRSQIDRFLSPGLLGAVQHEQAPAGPVAVLFCDLGDVASREATPARSSLPDALGDVLMDVTCLALNELLEHGAVVDVAQGEMLVGVFRASAGFDEAAARALRAALTMRRLVGERHASAPAVGIAAARTGGPQEFFADVGVAAALQIAARGGVLVDEQTATALGANGVRAERAVPMTHATIRAYEVRP